MDLYKLLEFRNGVPGFAKETGIKIVEVREGYARAEMPVENALGNPIGSVHGGAIFTLADTAGGVAATSRGSFVTTVNGEISYLNAAIHAKVLTAETRERKAGKNILVYDVDITDEEGTLIAASRMTYYSLHKEVVFS